MDGSASLQVPLEFVRDTQTELALDPNFRNMSSKSVREKPQVKSLKEEYIVRYRLPKMEL